MITQFQLEVAKLIFKVPSWFQTRRLSNQEPWISFQKLGRFIDLKFEISV